MGEQRIDGQAHGEEATVAGAAQEAGSGQRSSDPNWTAPTPEEEDGKRDAAQRPRFGVWLASALLGAGVASAGWFGSADVFEDKASQQVANHWLELRTCLLGPRLPAGVHASKQARFVTLGSEDVVGQRDWPARCAPYSQALDDALQLPSTPAPLKQLPSVTAAIAQDQLLQHGTELDALYHGLGAANLPSAKDVRPVPPAPSAARRLFRASQLAAWGRVEDLSHISVRTDSSHGDNLRLLLPEDRPVVCSLNDSTTKSQRWRSAVCRQATNALPKSGILTLARYSRGAPSLLQLRDADARMSYFDANTGLRLWRAKERDAQAAINADGHAMVLELAPALRRGSGKRRKRPKLVQLTPGKQPRKRTLRLKRDADVVLLPDSMLWWQSSDEGAVPLDQVAGQRLTSSGKKQRVSQLGRLPYRSQLYDDCAGAFGQAHLTRNSTTPPRHTLLFHRDGAEAATTDAGVMEGRVTMACHGRGVTLLRQRDERAHLTHCDRRKCREIGSVQLPATSLGALGSIDDQVVAVWGGAGGPLRIKVAKPQAFNDAPAQLLLEDAEHTSLQVASLRIVSANGLALLLLQGSDGQVYALRIDNQGDITIVSAVR